MRAMHVTRKAWMRIRYFLFSALLTALLMVPVYLYYQDTFRVVVQRDGGAAMNMATTIARFLEEDIKNYRALSESDLRDDTYDEAYYERMLGVFHSLREKSDATYVFSERIRGDTAEYVLDGEPTDSVNFSPIGSQDNLSDVERTVFETGKAQATSLEDDPYWGMFVTGYAPIVDPRDGAVVGLVGVDYASDHIIQLLRRLRILIYITAITINALIVLALNTVVHRRLVAMRADHLTGLLTKQTFEAELTDAVARADGKHSACLAMIDIDRFKEINDTYGHINGDRVLQHAGRIIRHNIRKTDMAARFGGDELLVYFDGANAAQAQLICRRFADSVQRDPPQMEDGGPLPYTLSIGIAALAPGMDAEDLVERADAAMYNAKNGGKDRIWMDAPGCAAMAEEA